MPSSSPRSSVQPLALAALFVVACGHTAPAAPAVPAAPVVAAAVAPPPRPVAAAPADTIRRSAIRSALEAGPGAFLQKVSLDDHPVLQSGKFHGFRIASLEGDSFRGVDLQPGDVVTRIEGMPIEHPEEAIEAFHSLQVASELRVDYERDGVPRMLRYPIVDDDGPAASGSSSNAKK
jgi:type II secretory pathway component PulC